MIQPFGEAALLVGLGATWRVHALDEAIRSAGLEGVVECVPGIETLLIELDPLRADADQVSRRVAELVRTLPKRAAIRGRDRSIPVVYGGEHGPDLEEVSRITRLAPDEVVALHSGAELAVEILGFAAGFAYIGRLPAELDVPRLTTPRTRTAAGSVAIAGRWTGVYPAELPGGWRVIGRTPITLFDPRREPPAYLAPGDRVRFGSIAAHAWADHAGVPDDW